MTQLGRISRRAGVALAFVSPLLFFKHQHGLKLVGSDRAQGHMNTEPERGAEIQRTPEEHSSLGRLCGIKPVQRAMITPPTVIRRVVAKPRIA